MQQQLNPAAPACIFWGINERDPSGLAVHFKEVASGHKTTVVLSYAEAGKLHRSVQRRCALSGREPSSLKCLLAMLEENSEMEDEMPDDPAPPLPQPLPLACHNQDPEPPRA